MDGSFRPPVEGLPLSQVELLWAYTYALSDRHTEQQTWLDERYSALSEQDISKLNLYQSYLRGQEELEYTHGCIALQKTISDEKAALDLLEKVEEGEATNSDVEAFIPVDFIEEQRKARIAKEEARKKEPSISFTRSYDYVFSGYDYLYAGPLYSGSQREGGRLTTGRNRTELNGSQLRLNGRQAIDAFFMATADTHGGKVRKHGKDGRTYGTKSGKRLRKY
jgi:hypothetical protein